MTATTADVSAVLVAAAARLEEHGWCQRQSRTGSGALCPIAAIAVAAAGDKQLEDRAQHALEIWVIWHSDAPSVARWNDAPERTKDEVLAALNAAALEVTLTEQAPVTGELR
jgi:hypothetical protein